MFRYERLHQRGGGLDCSQSKQLRDYIDREEYKENDDLLKCDGRVISTVPFRNVQFKNMTDSPSCTILAYLIMKGHYQLYVKLLQNHRDGKVVAYFPRTFRERRFLWEVLVIKQREDPGNDWVTPLISNPHTFSSSSPHIAAGTFGMLYRYFPSEDLAKRGLATGRPEVFLGGILEDRDTETKPGPISDVKVRLRSAQSVLQFFSEKELAKVYEHYVRYYNDISITTRNLLNQVLPGIVEKQELHLQTKWKANFVNHLRYDLEQPYWKSESVYSRVLQEVPGLSKDVYREVLNAAAKELLVFNYIPMNLLDRKIYPHYKEFLDSAIVEEICKQTAERHVQQFRFADLLSSQYFPADAQLDNYDKYIKAAIDTGFAISGSGGNFEQFFEKLQRTTTRLITEWEYDEDAEKLRLRVDNFLSYFLQVYSDILVTIQYTENLPPRSIDALYMYAWSSAVVNEPFKQATFTETQTHLDTSRRRPTQVQHRYITEMDEILNNAPRTTRPLYAWRGIAVPSFDVVNLELDIFKSLSLSPDVSTLYLRDKQCCLMRVLIPVGVPLMAMDPVQKHKNEGGLYEFVLPRGAIFKLVATVHLGGRTVYDTVVQFDQNYAQNLAVGRLRTRKITGDNVKTINPMTKRTTMKKVAQFSQADVKWLADTIVAGMNQIFTELTTDDYLYEHFRKLLLSHGTNWRLKRLAVGQYIDDDTFITMMKEVLIHVGNSLHNLNQTGFLQKVTNYPLNIDEFLIYGRNRS